MGFIGEIIGGVIGALISGIIAICISRNSIKQERKEIYEEKLQGRKYMWLNEHYRDLYIEFKNLANFNESIATRNGKECVPALEGYSQILGTRLVEYHVESNNYIKVEMKLTLNNVKKEIYKNSTCHLIKGYQDICSKMEELWKSENEYKDSLSSALNDILKRALELMESNFPDLSPSLEAVKEGDNSYNIAAMWKGLVINLVQNTDNLEFDPTRGMVYTESVNTSAIAFLCQTKYDKFKNNVWEPLNNEFKEKIKELNEYNNKLSKSEIKFQDSIRNIMDDYKSGHAIEGYCDVCKEICDEKDIKKLRPKV